jgi:hypothetical protein
LLHRTFLSCGGTVTRHRTKHNRRDIAHVHCSYLLKNAWTVPHHTHPLPAVTPIHAIASIRHASEFQWRTKRNVCVLPEASLLLSGTGIPVPIRPKTTSREDSITHFFLSMILAI